MNFIMDIMGRDDKYSSKKLWFNLACLVASGCMVWITYKDTMDDYAYILLYLIYLACLGGFEIIPKLLAMVLEFKTGRQNATTQPVS